MISVSNLTVTFGGFTLYDGISFMLNPRDRVGLAGKNGAGKSTLLKVIAGLQKPDTGDIGMPNGTTIGYLAQDMQHNMGKTVFDEASSAFAELKETEAKIARITAELETRTDYETDAYMQLITQLTEASERVNMLGGSSIEGQVEQTLKGLGFEHGDIHRLMDEFSGGWRMRVELAKLLLRRPDVLLLDEPTNHLDIESIMWLEEFLKTYDGSVILVSHDRSFLDNITNRTVELSMGKLFDYKANYSRYLMLRKERRETQLAAAKNQQREIEKTEKLIDQFRAKASKASFAQSLIKKLDRMDIIEIDEEDTMAMRFRFPPAPRSGKVVVEAADLVKEYDGKKVLNRVDFHIEREDKVAFVGKNGEGKSTMVRLIMGEKATSGKVAPGFSVEVGYFAQDDADNLDGNKTVFDTIDEQAVGDVRKQVRGILGSFLFSGDSIDKKVKVLSGGERTRLALCRLLLKPHNLLILDEPTNHLDLRSKDVLKQALLNFDGTLIIVSHDRDFLSGLTTKTFEFKGGNVKPYIGDVNEFLLAKKAEDFRAIEKAVSVSTSAPATKNTVVSKDVEAAKAKEQELRALKSQLSASEKKITELEKKIADFDAILSDSTRYQEMVNDKTKFQQYEELKKKLDAEMVTWEGLQSTIDGYPA
ncbi:MAG TPA: ABC-F family ATP-binding cassette domain-containing protein [Bacteroidia bacterium]|nr:ABC-F family ATP-binding cassette domain-containing protein [Bacteroidia bacterium]